MAAVHDLYKAQLLRSRAKFLGSLTELKGEAITRLGRVADDLDATLIQAAKKGALPIDLSHLRKIEAEIAGITAKGSKGITSLLDNQLRVSVETAAIGKQKAGNVFSSFVKVAAKEKGILKIPEVNVAFGGGMANFSEELIKQVWDKRWVDGKKLSQRIWNFNRITEKDLLRKVKAGIGEGKSARDISKGLRGYLTKDGRGSPVYRSMRIARTETNEAYKLAHQEIAKRETFVKGTKWNLSGSHKKTDVCDDLAEGGPRGDGVYPVAEYPGTPHPLCLCFPTDETPTVDEFLNRQKEVPGYGWVDKADMPGNEEARYLKEAMPYAKRTTEGVQGHQQLRQMYMRKLGFGIEEKKISEAVDLWTMSSDNEGALWLRGIFNKISGQPAKMGMVAEEFGWAQGFGKINNRMVKAVKAYKAYTQAYLKARSIEKVELLRGIGGEQARQLVRAKDKGVDIIKLKMRSISSFTKNKKTAITFAERERGVYFKVSAKSKDIFTLQEIELSLRVGEGEFILSVPRGEIEVIVSNVVPM